MKSLKILMLSSVFLFTNCSLIHDKFFSNSNQTTNEKSKEQEQEMDTEIVYIEDKKEVKKVEKKEGLQGDAEYQNNLEYPNLADVPQRPDSSISLEEQDNIVKNFSLHSVKKKDLLFRIYIKKFSSRRCK